ncbi:hypothetical protein KI659_18245 [Litoribacter alkaliphilus]|uniref:Uncharacterized protein n=1 Tax=Litoribacter ruber TaxID=702568 RepID=A0AAP2G2L9_9BACT|nr:hypothetical protein [Litoribacter alkaliphilus]MBS9525967.1 hypothetical protein [Litoribacter alkaliphilus]
MARQSSFIKLEGTIGDVTFFKGKNGYHARQKGGISKERIMNDDAFERTRENLAEFARAASGAKLLKDAFREITVRARDLRTHNRLYSQALKVLKTDTLSDRGERRIENGEMGLFTGFQFSNNCMFEATIYAKFNVEDDGTDLKVAFDAFSPRKYLSRPNGATDFRMFLVGTGVNFQNGENSSQIMISPVHKLSIDALEGLELTVAKSEGGGDFQFFALGVEFLQEVNGKTYTLNNGAHNAAKIIQVI